MIVSTSPGNRSCFLACLFLFTAALPLSASAQRFTLVALAVNEAVQMDLGVTQDIALRLGELNIKYQAAADHEFTRREIDYNALNDLPALERAAELRKLSEKAAEENRKLSIQFQPELDRLLNPQQVARLKQIQLQAAGIDLWLDPHLTSQLDLSDEQKSKLTVLRAEYNSKTQMIVGNIQQRIAHNRELNTERDRRAISLLSESQQSKVNELQGAPFDVSQLNLRRRGNH